MIYISFKSDIAIFDVAYCRYLYLAEYKRLMNTDGKITMDKKKEHVITEIIEYLPQAIDSKTIMNKITGNITASSLDEGMQTGEQISHFEKYIQIIDGTAELTIDQKLFTLIKGQGIIIPANSNYNFNANKQFKMISTVIKSGYEE